MTGVISLLTDERLVIAPDMLGHGKTEGPSRLYTARAYIQWLDSFIGTLGNESVQILGHSLGGAVGLRYAYAYPEKVDRLILVNPVSLGFPSLKATLRLLLALSTRDEALSDRLIGEVLFYGGDSRRLELVHRHLKGKRNIPHGLLGFMWMFSRTWCVALPVTNKYLQAVQPPVYVLWGKEDAYFPSSHGRRALHMINRSTVAYIPDAGHVPFLEQPLDFKRKVVAFLASD
jgi:pimeloyl-ACP methyl ester carboxylesterase